MKPLVVRSIEDGSGQRCVDVRRDASGLFSWAECRWDPEDGHGWRFLRIGAGGFSGAAEAEAAAVACVDWKEDRR